MHSAEEQECDDDRTVYKAIEKLKVKESMTKLYILLMEKNLIRN